MNTKLSIQVAGRSRVMFFFSCKISERMKAYELSLLIILESIYRQYEYLKAERVTNIVVVIMLSFEGAM